MTSRSPPSSPGPSHPVPNAKPPETSAKAPSSNSNDSQEPAPLYTLEDLRMHLSGFPPKLMAQMESICHLLQKVQEELREHNKQGKDFLQLLETWSQPLDSRASELQVSRVSPGHGTSRESVPAPPQQPKVPRPQPSSPQRPAFQDREDTRSPPWSRQLSQEDALPAPRPHTWPFWNSQQPQLWQDLLTRRLWQIFSGTHHEATKGQLRHRALSSPPRVTAAERAPGLGTREILASQDTVAAEACAGDALGPSLPAAASSSSSSEGSGEGKTSLDAAAAGLPSPMAQEPAGAACPFLKPICWDPEDFEDAWKRPGSFPWQSRKLGVPYGLEKVRTLKHGEPVLAAAVSSRTPHVFTCGRAGVKVWSLTGQVAKDRFPETHLPVQTPGAYLRTRLLCPGGAALLTGGGRLAGVCVWDLAAPWLRVKAQLPCGGLSCQALAAGPDRHSALAAFADGTVRMWDLRGESVVRELPGPRSGTTGVAVRGHAVWTGGPDARLRRWDLRAAGEPQEVQFESQIMSLAPSPREDWVLLGLANGQQWLQHPGEGQRRAVGPGRGGILGLKFSPYGQWWVSVGLDDLVGIYSMPTGKQVFQVPETSSVICCDVASNNRLLVTGSVDSASVYQITY